MLMPLVWIGFGDVHVDAVGLDCAVSDLGHVVPSDTVGLEAGK